MKPLVSSAIGAIFVMMSGPLDAAQPMHVVCNVSGEKWLVPAMAAGAVCERIRDTMARELRKPIGLIAAAAQASGDWVSIEIGIGKPGIVTARFAERRSGRMIVHPVLSIAVSDRAPGPATIDTMAREIAKAMAAKPHT